MFRIYQPISYENIDINYLPHSPMEACDILLRCFFFLLFFFLVVTNRGNNIHHVQARFYTVEGNKINSERCKQRATCARSSGWLLVVLFYFVLFRINYCERLSHCVEQLQNKWKIVLISRERAIFESDVLCFWCLGARFCTYLFICCVCEFFFFVFRFFHFPLWRSL